MRLHRPPRTSLPDAPYPEADCLLDARLHALDRQIVDVDGRPVGVVDDLELDDALDENDVPTSRSPRVVALLTGNTLPSRIFGGQPPTSRLTRIDMSDVGDFAIAVRLTRHHDELDRTWAERWVRDQLIRRIPGGSHDPR
ncbi:hypothetical protein DFR67_106144 [Williamsia limnetica]|jgi:hypothetical protein|uniref:Uncharacterized protein n=1 Tax=Williamsia limnetica TaxID=882452 RepID=A0A318RIR6_WILLI|nr:hypothetical protein [Williamsia limnetica]PYE17441.1 hypothetical protein DFR67_106144 [Williamsia limnetica]